MVLSSVVLLVLYSLLPINVQVYVGRMRLIHSLEPFDHPVQFEEKYYSATKKFSSRSDHYNIN